MKKGVQSACWKGGFWSYLVFSHGWTWLLWTAAWAIADLGASTIWSPPALWLFVFGGMGVLLGGIVMTRRMYGPAGLRDLARRVVDPRCIPGRWWAVVLLFFPALTLLAAALAGALNAGEPPLDFAGTLAHVADPVGLIGLVAFTFVIGPLPEEIGWRGYLLDRVQGRWKALSACLIIGLLHWSWHLPLFVLPGYADAFKALPPTPLHLAFVVLPATILYVWVYNNTGRSVLAVVVFHFMGNFSGEFLGISEETLTLRFVLAAIAALLVVCWWGPASLRRNQRSAPTGSPRPENRETN